MKKKKSINFTLQVLKTIATAGAITAVMLMPGLAVAFTPDLRKKNKNHPKVVRDRLFHIIWRLKKRGLIQQNSDGKLSLTTKGKNFLSRHQLKNLDIAKPKRWDGKWRVVAFDVWEMRRSARDLLRKSLENFGFIKLQNSLWIYPYDCEELIALLQTHLRLFSAIQYMVVEKISSDRKLRKHFNLPPK